jgi:hypothetical protein
MENKVSVLLSDGRLLFWELTTIDFKVGRSSDDNYEIH